MALTYRVLGDIAEVDRNRHYKVQRQEGQEFGTISVTDADDIAYFDRVHGFERMDTPTPQNATVDAPAPDGAKQAAKGGKVEVKS